MPVNQRLDQFTTVQLVVVVSVVHLEVMELQLLVRHLAGVDWNVHVLSNVTKIMQNLIRKKKLKTGFAHRIYSFSL